MKSILPLIILSILIVPYSFCQTTVNLPPVQDNSIYSGFTSNSNGIGPSIFSGTPGSGNPNRALMQFDIAGNIPATATITNVVLTLNCEARGGGSSAENHSVHYVFSPWGEGPSLGGGPGGGGGVPAIAPDATWLFGILGSAPWLNPGGDFAPVPSATTSVGPTGVYTWSGGQTTNDVQLWLNNPTMNNGWLLKIDVEGVAGTSSRWTSREGPPALVPNLAVTYTDPLGIDDEVLKSFRIYPNPTKGLINISVNPEIELERVRILNLLGQVLVELDGDAKDLRTIDFSHLQSGAYLLEIDSERGKNIRRVVKN